MTFHFKAILSTVKILPILAAAMAFTLVPTATPAAAAGVEFTVMPTSIDFGDVQLGTTVKRVVKITNTSLVQLKAAPYGYSGWLSMGTTTCGSTLAIGQSCTRELVFTPTQTQSYSGSLSAGYYLEPQPGMGAPVVSKVIPVAGRGFVPPPQFAVSPASIDFGNVRIGTTVKQLVTITNTGQIQIKAAPYGYSGWLSMGATTCGSTLAIGQSCTRELVFTPTEAQAYSGSLSLGYYVEPQPGMGASVASKTIPVIGRGFSLRQPILQLNF